MGKPAGSVVLSESDRTTLERWRRARTGSQRLALRAHILLRAAAGQVNAQIARACGTSRPAVLLWRKRFAGGGVAALRRDAPGRGRRPVIPRQTVDAIVRATTQTKPRGATHWSTRTMARAYGVSNATVARICQAHGLQPHRVRTFKLSRDPRFAEKLRDVVGLYLHPPAKALVLSADEKSQVQALDRTQPGLPITKGRCGTMTDDYKRNGTPTLFAALNVLVGKVLGRCYPRHRNGEFRKFLQVIDATTSYTVYGLVDSNEGFAEAVFTVTGGTLASAFGDSGGTLHFPFNIDPGLDADTFTLDWDFAGDIQGTIGSVPEPSSLLLLCSALLGLGALDWRRRRT